jgi:hypothetical protein
MKLTCIYWKSGTFSRSFFTKDAQHGPLNILTERQKNRGARGYRVLSLWLAQFDMANVSVYIKKRFDGLLKSPKSNFISCLKKCIIIRTLFLKLSPATQEKLDMPQFDKTIYRFQGRSEISADRHVTH